MSEKDLNRIPDSQDYESGDSESILIQNRQLSQIPDDEILRYGPSYFGITRGAEYILPFPPTIDEQRNLWNFEAENYLELRQSDRDPTSAMDEPQFMMALNGLPRGKKVLTTAAGDGRFEENYLANSALGPESMVISDFSEVMVQRAFHRLARYPHIRVAQTSMDDLSEIAGDEEFDLNISINGAHYLPNPRKALYEANRTTSFMGNIAWMFKHPDRNRLNALFGTNSYLPGHFYAEKWRKDQVPMNVHYRSMDQWLNDFHQAGWQVQVQPTIAPPALKLRGDSGISIFNKYLKRPSCVIVIGRKVIPYDKLQPLNDVEDYDF